MSNLVLALDIGSSSARCSAYDQTGTYLAGSRRVQMYRNQRDGTLDLETATRGCENAMDGTLAAVRTAAAGHSVVGVGLSVFALSWVGVDARGQAATPLYSYACRHGAQAAGPLRSRLQAAGLADQIYAASGVPIHTAYAPALLCGIHTADPEMCAQVRWWQTLGAYLLSRWFGQVPSPISTCEAGWTGLEDRAAGRWLSIWTDYLPLRDEQLPPLQDYAQGLHGLQPPWADRWPELADIPFFLAVGDGAAANIGSGALDNHALAVTIGTSAAVRVLVPDMPVGSAPATPTGLWCYRVDRTRHLLGGAITDGGNIVRWLHDMLALPQSELEKAAAELAPDAHGLTLLPFLHGERSPGWADNASMTMHGITAATQPGHLLRAGMEAVAFRLVLIARLLEDSLQPDAVILASGGALVHSRTWRQIVADLFGREVRLLQETEVTSRGAALLAWEALGQAQTLQRTLPVGEVAHPTPQAASLYAAALQRHEDLYVKLM